MLMFLFDLCGDFSKTPRNAEFNSTSKNLRTKCISKGDLWYTLRNVEFHSTSKKGDRVKFAFECNFEIFPYTFRFFEVELNSKFNTIAKKTCEKTKKCVKNEMKRVENKTMSI